MPTITFRSVLHVLLASLIVGMVMAWFNVQPRDILAWITGNVDEVFANLQAWIGWGIKYVLLGAVIVVPIWLLGFLVQYLRRR